MNKKMNILTVLFLIIVVTLASMNYGKYRTIKDNNNLIFNQKREIKLYKSKLLTLEKSNLKDEKNSQNNSDLSENNNLAINDISSKFLNAYMNYSMKNKNEIYKKIIPFSTDKLQSKLKVSQENELESDINYDVSIKNIRIYNENLSNDFTASVLVLADQEMKTNSSDGSSTLLIELKLLNVNGKWFVDDISVSKPLQNSQIVDK